MEVNVDLLDQMELIDISDQETLDVFFSSGEDGVLTSPLPGRESRKRTEIARHTRQSVSSLTICFYLTRSPRKQQQ